MGKLTRDWKWNGRLEAPNSRLTKASVSEYRGSELPEGTTLSNGEPINPVQIYRILRSPQALSEAVEQFKGLPLQTKHIPFKIDDHDKSIRIGSIGQDVEWKEPYIIGTVFVDDGDAINAIKKNEIVELSPSYKPTVEMKSGEYNGEYYDGVFTKMMFDHVALVEIGRSGPDVRIGDKQLKKLNDKGKLLVSNILGVLKKGTVADSNKNSFIDQVIAASGLKKKQFIYCVGGIAGKYVGDEDKKAVEDEVEKTLENLGDEDKVKIAEEDKKPPTADGDGANGDGDGANGSDGKNQPPGNTTGDDNTTELDALKEQIESLQSENKRLKEALDKKGEEVGDSALKILRKEQKQYQRALTLTQPIIGNLTEDTIGDSATGIDLLRHAWKKKVGTKPSNNMTFDDLYSAVEALAAPKNIGDSGQSQKNTEATLSRFPGLADVRKGFGQGL